MVKMAGEIPVEVQQQHRAEHHGQINMEQVPVNVRHKFFSMQVIISPVNLKAL